MFLSIVQGCNMIWSVVQSFDVLCSVVIQYVVLYSVVMWYLMFYSVVQYCRVLWCDMNCCTLFWWDMSSVLTSVQSVAGGGSVSMSLVVSLTVKVSLLLILSLMATEKCPNHLLYDSLLQSKVPVSLVVSVIVTSHHTKINWEICKAVFQARQQ